MNPKITLAAAAIAGLLSGSAAVAASTGTPSTGQSHIAGIAMNTMADKGTHSCKGANDCKGQGGCKGSGDSCKGKNDCKGKGGCATDGSKK